MSDATTGSRGEPGRKRVIDSETIARAPRRIEGRDKVMGRVKYAGDIGKSDFAGDLDVAVAITSTQASGCVIGFETADAFASPGVRALLTHENATKLHKVMSMTGTEIGSLLPLQDEVVRYGGQCVAVLIADTLEHARTAAALVRVVYSAPVAGGAYSLHDGIDRAQDAKSVGSGDPAHVEVGNPDAAYDAAELKVDLTFETPPHHHNAMEPGAIVAEFSEDGRLTVRLPTQFCYGDAMILGQAFGYGMKDRLPRILAQVLGGIEFDNNVRVISTMSGGAFGSKNGNVHLLLAPMAAKLTGRPVKLVLTRQQTFSMMPFRGGTRQRLRLAATGGKLQSLIQDAVVSQGAAGSYVEPAGEVIPKSYACANIRTTTRSARLDTNSPGWMRGPGASLGSFALETAMDELAYASGIDPLEFRLRNHADVEPDTGHEWSSKSLRLCYDVAAKRIGWFDRSPEVGSMREGRQLVGIGMATAIYPVRQMPAVARVTLRGDGTAVVQTATHEIGQGTVTAMTQIAAEALGVELRHVTLAFGDTALPYGGMAVGSMSTLTSGTAIHRAADMVKTELTKLAVRNGDSPLSGLKREDVDVRDGAVVSRDGRVREPIADVMRRSDVAAIEKEAITGRSMGKSKFGRQTFGAQFARVSVDPETLHVQVDRLVGAFAGGRAINPLLVRSQLLGAMTWGLGQTLFEESVMDARTGIWMTSNLGEALVPTHADVDRFEAIVIDEDDTRATPLGIKGMGELGGIGTAAAIGNAIRHATGIRLTSLPFRIDRLLDAAATASSRSGPGSAAPFATATASVP